MKFYWERNKRTQKKVSVPDEVTENYFIMSDTGESLKNYVEWSNWETKDKG